ncbi:MAG: GNAT family N-acetyltransferase [Oscillospiraceae bacterium]|jgi:phosphinothricin acetyltransferase|nr:GNAT family N-acetyltransferase [Oscillospiraceae bacterium]
MNRQESYGFAIRDARTSDSAAILAIYAPHVLGGAITFETALPTVEDMAGRILTTALEYPYFVAEDGSGILGYAYAGRVRSREAYQWSAELSIYVRDDAQGRGIGRALVTRVISALRIMGVKTLYAVITSPNPPSEAFHERLGFKRLAVFENMGYKLGRWRDVLWMSLTLGAFDDDPEAVTPHPCISAPLQGCETPPSRGGR